MQGSLFLLQNTGSCPEIFVFRRLKIECLAKLRDLTVRQRTKPFVTIDLSLSASESPQTRSLGVGAVIRIRGQDKPPDGIPISRAEHLL
jgi:hypothetical protein